jgi:hypothetical protein
MAESLAIAFEQAGFEVDAEETRLVILRSNGSPVLELDWTTCDLRVDDLARIGKAFIDAGE